MLSSPSREILRPTRRIFRPKCDNPLLILVIEEVAACCTRLVDEGARFRGYVEFSAELSTHEHLFPAA